MRFMVLVPGSRESERGEVPDTDLLDAMTRYNQQLVEAGVMIDGDGLRPTSDGVRIRFDGRERSVVDGPFADGRTVAGYWIWECATREDAIEWLKRAPFDGGTEVELRQIAELEDFDENLTPETRKANEELGQRTR